MEKRVESHGHARHSARRMSDCRPTFFRRMVHLGLVAALCSAFGLHWFLMQAAAWSWMLVEYSSSRNSIAQAVAETFDGQHPCKFCKRIEQEKKNTATAPVIPLPDKLDLKFPPMSPTAALSLAFAFQRIASIEAHAATRWNSPPTPPPRA